MYIKNSITVDISQLIGYDMNMLASVPYFAKTVAIHIILSTHAPNRHTSIGENDLPMPLNKPVNTSMLPHMKYVVAMSISLWQPYAITSGSLLYRLKS